MRNEKSLQEELREASENEERSGDELGDTTDNNYEAEAKQWIDDHVKSKHKDITKDVKKMKKAEGMRRLRNWFCDSDTEEEEVISSSEDEKDGEKEWESVQRKKDNEEKKTKMKLKREKKRATTASKASNILGLGPITRASVDYFEKKHKNFEKAKMEAVNEFLQFYLNYDEDEIKDLGIEATQMAKDEVIYLFFTDQSNIREVYGRIALSQNTDIISRNFVPPQFFE